MTLDITLQCARVDRFPDRRMRDSMLPNVIEGSTTAACYVCRQQVWVSKVARNLAARGEAIRPVCDVCKPANSVRLGDIHDVSDGD